MEATSTSNLSDQPNNLLSKSLAGQLVESTQISLLRARDKDPHIHSQRQLDLLKKSIKRFGLVHPVLLDHQNRVIAGWGIVQAAKQLGFSFVSTLRIEHLSEEELRAYAIANNQLATKAGWDKDLLCIELQGLIEIGFDAEELGFETAEIDILQEEFAISRACDRPEDQIPEKQNLPVTKLGDVWNCERHRVSCGDAQEQAAYEKLFEGQKAALVITDPPYNVKIRGHVSGLGKHHHREFPMASGEMSQDEFVSFLKCCFSKMANFSNDGTLHYIFMDWRHTGEILNAGTDVFSKLLNICVWCKTNAGMGSFYRSQHEFVFVWRNGSATHVNNIELGRFGRSRSNVWSYPGVNTFKRGREEELSMHPTTKPVELIADAIKDGSSHDAIILDPFLGSGTTLIAAEKTGRRGFGIELDPLYIDVAIRRWQIHTGKKAVHADTGQTFDQIDNQQKSTVGASHEQ